MLELRILIVGGYGTFGGRLAVLLKDEPRLTLLIAGRSLDKARQFCERTSGSARFIATHFDRDIDAARQLLDLAPDLLVDASGPFQMYGQHPYRLIEACIDRGINYVDLADAAQFVAGVSGFNARAEAHGVFVLSGLSTCPTLVAAVVRRLSDGVAKIESITAGIAPSPHVGFGLSVLRGIAAYAGENIRVQRNGAPATHRGLLEQRRVTIGPPGQLPLSSRVFSLVDVPDSLVLPQLWPSVRTVWTGAAPVPLIFHRVLIAVSWLRRCKLLPSLTIVAPFMHYVTQHLRWGEHRGGMFVSIDVLDTKAQRTARTWHLIAEGDCGPFIPSMAAAGLIRRILAGVTIAPGARSGATDLDLSDYEPLFAQFPIVTGIRTSQTIATCLYASLLGDVWHDLPPQIRAMHGGAGVAKGVASVTRGTSILAKVAAYLIGFPPTATDIPVEVHFDITSAGERWSRRFGDHKFHSEHVAGRGREDCLLIERFGPICISMALVWESRRLKFVVRGWRLGPIRLPLWLAPTSNSHESVVDGRFTFDVSIAHPFAGLLVRYRGWLALQE